MPYSKTAVKTHVPAGTKTPLWAVSFYEALGWLYGYDYDPEDDSVAEVTSLAWGDGIDPGVMRRALVFWKEENMTSLGLNFTVYPNPTDPTTFIVEDQDGEMDVEQAAAFLQRYLRHIDSGEALLMEWGSSNAGRGGALLITSDDVEWMDPSVHLLGVAAGRNLKVVNGHEWEFHPPAS